MALQDCRMRAYFAAPLFNDMERSYNETIVKQIEPYAKIPQRDGGLLMQLVKEGTSPEAAEKIIFRMKA